MVTATVIDAGGNRAEASASYQVGAMSFGMWNDMPSADPIAGDTTSAFVTTRPMMGGGKCRMRRSFNPPSWYGTTGKLFTQSAAKDDWSNGIIPVWSFRISDIDGVIAGNHFAKLRNLGASIPDGTRVACWHEPENKAEFLGANLGKFKPFSQRVHDGLKAGNPNIVYVYAAIEYRYRPQFSDVNDWLNRWYPGDAYVDMLSVDTYVMDWEASGNLVRFRDMPGHMKWHGLAAATGKPLGVTEWAVEKAPAATRTDAAVAAHIAAEIDWLRANGYQLCLWWNGDGMSDGNFAISNRAESRAAWVDAAAAYGVG
jgi:hypothetical protein